MYLDKEFPKTHALEDLVLIISMNDPPVRELFTLASELSPYAVEIRYPDTTTPTIEDADEALHSAELIRNYVQGKIMHQG